jgi:hypothetical protein
MFGHQENDQQQAQPFSQSTDGIVSAQPPADDFNPALPTPGTDFGSSDTPSPASPSPVFGVPSTAPLQSDSDQASSNVTNDLLDIKQQALSQLSPLVGHLDQSPEEKFRTTMMMIQASDNQDLVKEAYAAAQAITDEKSKAQALLDIVNEINYFTQHHQA